MPGIEAPPSQRGKEDAVAEQTESSWTESRFRQRLVGASVVVALAVLLLPLWLDGSGIDSLRVQTAPEKPEVEGVERIEVPQPPGETGEPLENPPTSLFPDQTPIEARETSRSDAARSGGESVEESEEAAASTPEEMMPESEGEAAEPASQAADEVSVVESAPEPARRDEDAESESAEDSAAPRPIRRMRIRRRTTFRRVRPAANTWCSWAASPTSGTRAHWPNRSSRPASTCR